MIAKFTYLKIAHKSHSFENGINAQDRNFEVTFVCWNDSVVDFVGN